MPTGYTADIAKAITEATKRLAYLQCLNLEQAMVEAGDEYNAACDQFNKTRKEREELRAKYEAMAEKVKAWEAPTPDHAEYKKFMLDQITESMRFDCSTQFVTLPKCKTAAEWLSEAIQKAAKDIAYHTKAHAEEVERAASRTAWVRALRDSLKAA